MSNVTGVARDGAEITVTVQLCVLLARQSYYDMWFLRSSKCLPNGILLLILSNIFVSYILPNLSQQRCDNYHVRLAHSVYKFCLYRTENKLVLHYKHRLVNTAEGNVLWLF